MANLASAEPRDGRDGNLAEVGGEPTAGPVEQPPPSQPKRRDPWFDNIKFALIVLVVVGHSWTLLPENDLNSWLYDSLYSWHIPAFVVITGYLSRSFSWSSGRMWNLFRTVAVPYVLFEGLLALFRTQVGHEYLLRLWVNPHWPMWYLLAMLVWRLVTPIFLRGPALVSVGAAIVVSVTAPLWFFRDYLDLGRILGLLPFFVIGLRMGRQQWDVLRRPASRFVGAAVLVTIVVLARFNFEHDWIKTEWWYYRSRYDDMHDAGLHAYVTRLVVLFVGTVGTLAFFAIVPRTRRWFTGLGAATLVVYLFHGFVVLGLGYTAYPRWTPHYPVGSLLLTTAGAAALVVLLAWPSVSRRLELLVDPLGTVGRVKHLTRRR